MRKKWSDFEKARIALMAIKEDKTIAEISQETGAHPNIISKWKKELLQNADSVFRNGKSEREKELEKEQEELYKQIGKLHAGKDFLKKVERKGSLVRMDIEPQHFLLTIEEQCKLLGKSRGRYYYKPYKDPLKKHQDNLEKKRIKDIWEQHIFFGYRQICNLLKNQGCDTSNKRVYRLMKELGIKAVIPKRSLFKPGKRHKKYPYLLQGLKVQRRNHVWASDLTYVKRPGGTA